MTKKKDVETGVRGRICMMHLKGKNVGTENFNWET
jgi:hypothetical protein